MNAVAPLEVPQPDRETVLAQRRTGIGGSDVAAILGLVPRRTPLDVYLEKLGIAEPVEETEPMLWGKLLEPVIRQRYSDKTGRAVYLPTDMLRHHKHTFMVANLDGFTEDKRVFEAKTARTDKGWGEPGSDEVPDAYALQVQHYLFVTGFEVADVAVLIGGSDFRLYHVHADQSLQADLIDAEAEFWGRVLRREEPEPVSFAEAQQRYGRLSVAGVVHASSVVAEAHAQLVRIRDEMKELEAREDAAKAEIVKALGDTGDTLISPDGRTLATWKLAKAPERFDTTAFKAAHPDLAAQFTKPGTPSRRLLIKE
jgi:putative phage-type endonuclease